MITPLLEAQDLWLRVGGRTLVRELSFRLGAGEVWCMLGPNGAGKSTFLHTAVGLREPQGGAMRLAGRALGDWPAAEAARQRGFLPQTFHDAFSASVLESVMLGRHPYLSRWQWEGEDEREIAVAALRAVDLTGRSGLVDLMPDSDVQAHEKALIKKIQLHTDDLQIVLREEGKTPDLIVAGVVTEMKSLDPKGDLAVQIEHANLQLLAHSKRHGLGSGAIAVDLTGRDAVPVEKTLATINAFAAANPVGFHRVEVYAGADRKVFTVGQSRAFALENATKTSVPRSASRFFVPNALVEAPVTDAQLVLREVVEPSERLKRAGVKATITAYGSARILSPEAARTLLQAAIKAQGSRPKDPKVRAALHEARQAVENSKWYAVAREFGGLVAVNGGGEIGLVTGGGPGIMEAANRGALEKGGPSIGYNIILDKEQGLNHYVTPGLEFEFQHFATRKMALRHGSMGLVYFPGGFGTMDELFEVLTLMQTRKMKRVPIVLVGEKSYWEKILDFDEFERMGLISHGDLSMFRFADTARGIWDGISAGAVLTQR